MPKGNKQWKLSKKFECPTCGAKLEVHWKEETIKPSVPAEKKEVFDVIWDTQTSLDKITEIHNKNQDEKKKLRHTITPAATTRKAPGRPRKH